MAQRTLAVIMAGGMGERLRPLTEIRTKPAVPFGAIYRIIDFTLSNCINSDVRQILVLTQYKSHSLSRHLQLGFNFLSPRLDEFIEEVPAQMQTGNHWYKGTADAIRQNLSFIDSVSAENVLILAGDHIYKMNYHEMLDWHRKHCMASMGIYIFENTSLHKWLDNDLLDFGRDVIPAMVAADEPVYAFDFSIMNQIEDFVVESRGDRRVKRLCLTEDAGYWRDVGTLDSFWQANLDLIAVKPPFSLYGEHWPIFRSPTFFPPAKFVHEEENRTGMAVRSIVAEGVVISGGLVRASVVGAGTFIQSYALVEASVIFGGEVHRELVLETSIGRHCRIRNAILDRHVTLQEGTIIGYDRADDERRGLKTASIAGGDEYVVAVGRDTVL